MEPQTETDRAPVETHIPPAKRLPGVSPHSAHRDLEAQAISVAESILGSPQVGGAPADMSNDERLTTVPLPAAVSLGVSHVFVPTSLLENLRISDGEGKQPSEREFENNDDEEDENPDQTSLFVGDLSRSVTEAMLKQSFSQHGEVLMVDVRRDKITQNNLGYGFVQMKTHDQALMGKKSLHGTVVGGRKIRIGWAQKNTTLFIGDLDGTITTEHLKEVFGKFGSLVEDETFVKAGSGKFGFVRFRYRIDAERAKAEMNGRFIGSRPCRIGWGENTVQKNCVHVQFLQGAHVYDNPLGENEIRDLFEKFGPVVSVSLPRYGNRRLKGYGFVHFQDIEDGEKAATAAIKALNDKTIAGVTLRCTYGKRQGAARVRNGYNYPMAPTGRGGGMNGFSHTGSPTGAFYGGGGGGGPNGNQAIRRRQLSWLMNSRNWQALQALALQADLQEAQAAAQALGIPIPALTGRDNERERDSDRHRRSMDRDRDLRDRDHIPIDVRDTIPIERDMASMAPMRGGDRDVRDYRDIRDLPREMREPRDNMRDNQRDQRDLRDRNNVDNRDMRESLRDSRDNMMRGGGGGSDRDQRDNRGGGSDRDSGYYFSSQHQSPPMDAFTGAIRPNNPSSSPPRIDQVHNLSSLFSSRSPQSDAFYASTMSTLASVTGPSSNSFIPSTSAQPNERSPTTMNGYINGHTGSSSPVNPTYNGGGRYMHSSHSSSSSLSSLSSPFTPLGVKEGGNGMKDMNNGVGGGRPIVINGSNNSRKSPSPTNYQS